MLERLRDRMPVAETNIRSTFVTVLKFVREQSKLQFGGDSAPLDGSVDGKIIVGGHDRPQMSDLHRNGTVYGEDLPMGLTDDHLRDKRDAERTQTSSPIVHQLFGNATFSLPPEL